MSDKGSEVSRRKFIARSLVGLAGAGLAGSTPALALAQGTDTEKKTDKAADSGEIIYRTLGRTGVKLPVVSMGVMNANNPEIVVASYDLGVRHFDTAARYAYGRNEQMVGDVVKRQGIRDKVQIATKIWTPNQRTTSSVKEAKDKFIKLMEGSLKRLKTDYADVVYVHNIRSAEEVNDEGAIEALRLLKEQGKVRATGVSTHQAMAAVINEVVRTDFFDVVLTAINVSMAANTDLFAAIKNASEKGVGIIAMKTQAGGQRLPNAETLRTYSGATVNTAMLKWVMRNPNIHTSIPGFDNFEHMKQDLSVNRSLEYTEDEEKFLSDNSIQLSLGFCQQCKGCLATCPRDTDIPTLMRTHMYAAQYGNFHEARITLDDIPQGQGLTECADCGDCLAKCANSVDIPHRISELKAMYA